MASISGFWQWYRSGCWSGPWPWTNERSARRSHWPLQGDAYPVHDIVNFCVDVELCPRKGDKERHEDYN